MQPNTQNNQPGVTQQMPTMTQVDGQVKPVINPNSTQNALLIAEIRDGIVIMKDGSFRAVVMCKSINFDLMSQIERDGVESSFQGFLNSLYFNVQIMVRSRKVDLRPYLEKLHKIKSEHDNMLLALLMEEYIYFMSEVAQQTNIMDKSFYVVVDHYNNALTKENAINNTKGMFGNVFNFNKTQDHVTISEQVLDQAKDELRTRVQGVMQGLQQCGIQSLPLDTAELMELYYGSYNPDTATRQHLDNFENLMAPVITKGQGNAVDPSLDKTVL